MKMEFKTDVLIEDYVNDTTYYETIGWSVNLQYNSEGVVYMTPEIQFPEKYKDAQIYIDCTSHHRVSLKPRFVTITTELTEINFH